MSHVTGPRPSEVVTASRADFLLGLFFLALALKARPESFALPVEAVGRLELAASLALLVGLVLAAGQALLVGLSAGRPKPGLGLAALGLAAQAGLSPVVAPPGGSANPGQVLDAVFGWTGAGLGAAALVFLAVLAVRPSFPSARPLPPGQPRQEVLTRLALPALALAGIGVYVLPLAGFAAKAALDPGFFAAELSPGHLHLATIFYLLAGAFGSAAAPAAASVFRRARRSGRRRVFRRARRPAEDPAFAS